MPLFSQPRLMVLHAESFLIKYLLNNSDWKHNSSDRENTSSCIVYITGTWGPEACPDIWNSYISLLNLAKSVCIARPWARLSNGSVGPKFRAPQNSEFSVTGRPVSTLIVTQQESAWSSSWSGQALFRTLIPQFSNRCDLLFYIAPEHRHQVLIPSPGKMRSAVRLY